MTPVFAENHCLLFRQTIQWLLSCVLSFKNMVEHVGHVIVGLSMYAPGSICFLQSMQVYVQINSLIATMKVSKETTLDLGSGCCVEATVISSFSVVMTVSKLDVTLSWLLKVDNTTFCRLRTSPLPNSMFSARSLHKTSSMCPVLSAR